MRPPGRAAYQLRDLGAFWIIASMAQDLWQVYQIEDLKKRVQGAEPRFFEFLSGARLSGGLYRLPAGAHDMQGPHLEDEVYVVLEGRAQLRVGAEEREVRPGMILFIRADAKHSFVQIHEDLTLLALFSAAEKPWEKRA
jgi:mannose-6-phosphate isomerase-like protein (cupin superfamily)